MRRRLALLGLPLVVTAVGCAPAGSSPGGGPDHRWAAFDQRAGEVAEAWRPGPAWSTGYVPLQDATVLVGDPGFTPDTEAAFRAGWYREQVEVPGATPADAAIRFPDGALTVPLVSATEAYRQLDQGDPPTCDGRPREPQRPGPDGATSTQAAQPCVPLTVTGVRLGSAEVRTSRGVADVPAWLFTVEELTAPVARLAVDPSAVTAVPEPTAPTWPATNGVVGADQLQRVDGARLTYTVAMGACDSGPTALVRERDDVVVVGGGVVRGTGDCVAMAVFKPVTVTLKAALGGRPVLDVGTGAVLTQRSR
ncbi:hypothetical protein [Micromonospora sp. NPDC092111]|uniref:hypothetical protein n=1 Tax=Micromonospora sp. NPDC092111 TaxID=3364289 RepID=UPI0038267712